MDVEALGKIAGFTLAQCALIGSGSDGEVMAPFAIVEAGENRQVINYEADSQQEAIDIGRKEIALYQGELDAWAFAREGVVSLEDGSKQDVYVLEAWVDGIEAPLQFYQSFQPEPFKLLGNVKIENFEMTGLAVEQTDMFLAGFDAGISSHELASGKWESWFE